MYSLHEILKIKKYDDLNLRKISGIFFRNSKNEIEFTKPIGVVPTEKMDEDLPGYAWDLLPYKMNH